MFSCDKVITIPQYTGTCWFNAILMALFYSQHSRKLLYHHFEDKKDKFSKIMNDIIKHTYIKSAQAIKYFEFMHPENILKYMNIDTKEFFKYLRNKKNYGFDSESFLPFFIKSLNKNVMDIIIYKRNCYANYYSLLPTFTLNAEKRYNFNSEIIKSNDITDPDYILVHKLPNDKSLNFYIRLFLKDFKNNPKLIQKLNIKHYNISIKGLTTLKDELVYNNNKYILDSIILNNNNYKLIKSGHVIAGITCKNNRYVYNGWFRITNDPNIITNNYGNDKLPCELMKFDWNVKQNNKFCLNPKVCKIDNYDKTRKYDLCFSFNDIDNATLIYVKYTSIKSIDTNLSITSSLTLPSLKSNSSNLSDLNIIDKKKYILERNKRKKEQEKYKNTIKQKVFKGFTYIDCLLAALFNNNNLAIEEIFFNIKLTNKYAIAIKNEFKSYYETKTYNKIKLLKAIQMYYNEFILKHPEYPKIMWAKGKYYFTDLIILLQQIFKFDKNLIQILLSYNEKFKIIDKKQITEIKTIQITKLKPNPPLEMKSLLLSAIVVRLDTKYTCFYKCKTKWYDNNNKIIENIDKHLKTEKYKIVSYVYY